MDAVETAIRSALEKGDALDRGFREKVYRSAFAVLERSLSARPDLPPDAATRRREHLKAKISVIESEFAPAVEPDAPRRSNDHLRMEPTFTPPPPSHPQAEAPPPEPAAGPDFGPLLSEADLAPVEDEAGIAQAESETIGAPPLEDRYYQAPRRNLRPLGWLFILLIFLVLLAAAIWWLATQGGFTGSNTTATTSETSSAEPIAADSNEGWITVFSPADPLGVNAPSGAKAQVVAEGDESFIKISSQSGDQPIDFVIGQGVLEQFAGKRAVFNIVARSEGGKPTQISVSCDSGALGDCGRSRFDVGAARSDYLFRVELERAQPAGGGTISIVPDVSGGGRALDVFEIRVSAAEE